jgi:hypothetical protein
MSNRKGKRRNNTSRRRSKKIPMRPMPVRTTALDGRPVVDLLDSELDEILIDRGWVLLSQEEDDVYEWPASNPASEMLDDDMENTPLATGILVSEMPGALRYEVEFAHFAEAARPGQEHYSTLEELIGQLDRVEIYRTPRLCADHERSGV